MAYSYLEVANIAETVLDASIDTDDTTITVQSGQGAEFPDGKQIILLTDDANYELVLCDSRSGDVFTVNARGYDGTTAQSWTSGDIVRGTIAAEHLRELQDNKVDLDLIAGGTTGQVWTKVSDDDYDAAWADAPGGGSLTSTLVDFNNSGVYFSVVDDNVADTLIVDTSKPGSPQYTKTITTLPSATEVDYYAIIGIAGFNNDGSTRTLNYRFTVNGTEIGASDGSISVTSARHWRAAFRYCTTALAANDVLGVKLWGSLTNVLDYRAVSIYIIPRMWGPGVSIDGQYMITTNQPMAVTGAIAGVTYVVQAVQAIAIYDHTINAGFATTTTANNALIAMKGQSASFVQSLSDSSVASAGNLTALELSSVTTVRYGRKVIFS